MSTKINYSLLAFSSQPASASWSRLAAGHNGFRNAEAAGEVTLKKGNTRQNTARVF